MKLSVKRTIYCNVRIRLLLLACTYVVSCIPYTYVFPVFHLNIYATQNEECWNDGASGARLYATH